GPVYKYKSLDGRGLEQVKEMIRDRVIYCPRPAILNDDRECKPAIVIGDIKDPAYWSSVERWVRNCLTRREPVPTEEQIQVELRGLTQAALDDMVASMAPEYHAVLNTRYRILSFADARDNAHRWDNYAGKFPGYALNSTSINSSLWFIVLAITTRWTPWILRTRSGSVT
uniref:hypothetical protein n=1 Tax=uncultured Caballeronia sp. TaxID=1827198 RepID=UPI0035CAB06C